jgi:Uma2 family endonuclease
VAPRSPEQPHACHYAKRGSRRRLYCWRPTLVIEVTSPSSAQDDRGAKFLQYQTIESLADYVLVDSSARAVLHYRKEGMFRQPRLVEDHAGVLALDNLGIGIPLDVIYADSGVG